jgi:hypothetical protein
VKKTSRRTFNQQLSGAVAALPLASFIADAQNRSETPAKPKNVQPHIRSEHNTPPPGGLMGGSLVFEAFTDKSNWNPDGAAVNHRLTWSVEPKPYDNGMKPMNIYIAHVKLIDGAGEMVFHFDNDATEDHTTQIEVTALLKDKNGQEFGDCRLTASSKSFVLSLPEDKKLKDKGDPPSNSKRKRVRYMKANNDDDKCDWVGLKIVKGGIQLYNQDLTKLPGYDESMRLLLWWENI